MPMVAISVSAMKVFSKMETEELAQVNITWCIRQLDTLNNHQGNGSH